MADPDLERAVADVLSDLERSYRAVDRYASPDRYIRSAVGQLEAAGRLDLDESAVACLLRAAVVAYADGTGSSRPVTLLVFHLIDRYGAGVLDRCQVADLDRFDHAFVDHATATALGRDSLQRATAEALRGRPSRTGDDHWPGTLAELITAAAALEAAG